MTYEPIPIDTSAIVLSKELSELTEFLAENTHDVWARRRLAEGWRYGPERNDANKTHPDLVRYSELVEAEKDYDRTTAMETVKVIVSRGYRIEPPAHRESVETDSSVPVSGEPTVPVPALQDIATLNLAGLFALWQARNLDGRSGSIEWYRQLAERLRELGEPLLAYDLVSEGLELWSADVRLRQLQGLALADSGAPRRANHVLRALKGEGHADEETLGMLARTYKDLWRRSERPAEKRRYLKLAYEEYAAAYGRTDGYWTGINAATMAFLRDDKGHAVALARRVQQQCEDELEKIGVDGSDRYWPLATLGEASLIQGEPDEARKWYEKAVHVAGEDYGKIASTHRQALILAEHLGIDRAVVEAWFPRPRVVVCAGHMIDQAGRPVPRFPAKLEVAVRAAVRARLQTMGPVIGYASAACGTDIIFLETVAKLGGTIHIVLPYQRDDFVRDSVDIIPGADWRERCERLLDQAEVTTVSAQRLSRGGISYEYANRVLLGLARSHTERLGTVLTPFAVWDGKAGDGPGGTDWIVRQWREQDLEPEVIHLEELLQPNGDPSTEVGLQTTPAGSLITDDTHIMALLFADVKGFAAMTEDQIPHFVSGFLGMVGDLVKFSEFAPETKNTWGDGLYMVFDGVRKAGLFALELAERVRNVDWTEHELPDDLSIRIALHAGPVHKCTDPVTGLINYTGTHVSRAARIEPITPPGLVYASQGFAALASYERIGDFACDYVGQTPLHKGYGTYPTYNVRRP